MSKKCSCPLIKKQIHKFSNGTNLADFSLLKLSTTNRSFNTSIQSMQDLATKIPVFKRNKFHSCAAKKMSKITLVHILTMTHLSIQAKLLEVKEQEWCLWKDKWMSHLNKDREDLIHSVLEVELKTPQSATLEGWTDRQCHQVYSGYVSSSFRISREYRVY
jgi:hypothetical protein